MFTKEEKKRILIAFILCVLFTTFYVLFGGPIKQIEPKVTIIKEIQEIEG